MTSFGVALAALLAIFNAIGVGATPQQAPMRNGDVLRLVKSGLNADTVEALVEAAAAVDFGLTTDAVLELVKEGVPESVIRAMTKRSKAAVAVDNLPTTGGTQEGDLPAAAAGPLTVASRVGIFRDGAVTGCVGRLTAFGDRLVWEDVTGCWQTNNVVMALGAATRIEYRDYSVRVGVRVSPTPGSAISLSMSSVEARKLANALTPVLAPGVQVCYPAAGFGEVAIIPLTCDRWAR